MGQIIKEWLISIGLSGNWAENLTNLTDFVIVVISSIIAYYIAKLIIVHIIKRLALKTASNWDDIMLEHKVFNRMAFLIPGIIIYSFAPVTLREFNHIPEIIQMLTKIYMIFVTLFIINSFFNAVLEISQSYELYKSKPIKGYIQVAKIIIFLIGSILIISVLINQSPMLLLGGLGAFSAVLLLVFKDALLGFVSSLQISANDMVRNGDWITMNKYGADGTVIDISLSTVKVQNWDYSITTLPTYSLISESFQNWRGMTESGVRRIKRSIPIAMSSIKFCTNEFLQKFENDEFIKDYIANNKSDVTNIEVFRAYVYAYLKQNPNLDHEKTLLVHQLQPTETGIPLEIYAFCKIQEVNTFEDIQASIIEHMLAIIHKFDLQVYQNNYLDNLRMINSKPGK
ncbi:MAG TPA: mechanosensitive ion channel [Bacteroidales bacterium]|mgnify:CR=1 FL=1|nr:mechanosensitive ion channel [Bacteroidales bacterium]